RTVGVVAGQSTAADRQRTQVEDAAAVVAVEVPEVAGVAVANRQAAQGDRDLLVHLEDPRKCFAADRQLAGARALNGHALADVQLAAGELDGLAVHAGREDDRVFVLGGGDLRPQRADAAVQVVRDRQRAGNLAAFERFKLGPKTRGWPA